MLKALGIVCGFIFLILAVAGIFLPLLPATPFLLLSVFFFARSSDRLHDWIMSHPQLGRPVKDWQDGGCISFRTKMIAMATIAFTFALSLVAGAPAYAIGIQGVILGLVSLFILTRPEHR